MFRLREGEAPKRRLSLRAGSSRPADGQRERHVGAEQEEASVDEPQDPRRAASGDEVHQGEAGDQVGEQQGAGEAGAGDADGSRREGGGNRQRREQREARRIGHRRQVRPVAPEPTGGARDAAGQIEIEREDGRPVGRQRARQGGDDELGERLDLLVAERPQAELGRVRGEAAEELAHGGLAAPRSCRRSGAARAPAARRRRARAPATQAAGRIPLARVGVVRVGRLR